MKAVINIASEERAVNKSGNISLGYLFFTFFKIGMVSFGGHMALVSVVQRILVERDKVIDNEQVLNSVGIASLLPGPLAVNVVGQIGYQLRKGRGAVASTVGIILPAFILMIILSWAYFSQRQFFSSSGILSYVTGTVCAVILATGFQLFKKEVMGNYTKLTIFGLALVALIYSGNYILSILILIAGGITGVLLQLQQKENQTEAISEKGSIGLLEKIALGLLAINQVIFFSNTTRNINNGTLKLVMIFAGISLSLFGGGYVMIPIMQSLFVNELHWVTGKEFIDAIAFSQATPGPILISATFIGYKAAGFAGALIATIAIFAPAVFLSVVVSTLINNHQANKTVKNLMAGVKTVVVALIISSAWKLIAGQHIDWIFCSILTASFILNFKYKVSPVYLVLGAILAGTIINFL
ncbi:MAG: chromate efflux transporter [Mucilaginibacter sp.]|nr:chromate efflux transporter [Mucilaginibacter sp.]